MEEKIINNECKDCVTKKKKFDKLEYHRNYRKNRKDVTKGCNQRYYNKKKDLYQTCDICACQIKGINMTQHKYTTKHKNNVVKNNTVDI